MKTTHPFLVLNRDEMLRTLKNTILNYESIPGHNVMSATQSSFDQWIHKQPHSTTY